MDAIRFIEGQSPTHEEFINLPNRLAQLVIPAPDNAEIHMDPISIDDNEYEGSSDDMEFDKASPLAPIVDDKYIGESGQEPHTPSDLHITFDARGVALLSLYEEITRSGTDGVLQLLALRLMPSIVIDFLH
jgi:hypothetical protein